MVIGQNLLIPKRTPESRPVNVLSPSTLPYLVAVDIVFPSGCVGLVHARVKDRGAVVAPMASGWLNGNAESVSIQCGRPLEGPPYQLTLEGYSQDDTYDHTLTVRYTLHE